MERHLLTVSNKLPQFPMLTCSHTGEWCYWMLLLLVRSDATLHAAQRLQDTHRHSHR